MPLNSDINKEGNEFQEALCPACGEPSVDAFEAKDRMHGLPGPFRVRKCTACGSGVTVPLETEDAIAAFYVADYYTHSSPAGVRKMLQDHDFHRRIKRTGLAHLKPGKLLEIGPGNCEFLLFMQRRGWQVMGLDPDDAVVKRGESLGISMLSGTVPALPADHAFDVIVAWHSIEHSVAPQRDLMRLGNALRPGGRLIVGLPNFGSISARIFGPYWYGLEVPRHRTHFTRAGLNAIAGASGLNITSFQQWLNPYAALNSMRFRVGKGPSGVTGTAGAMMLSPLAWLLERFEGDSMSAVFAKK